MTIEERLKKLEKELAILTKTVAAKPKQIHANTYIVEDEKGKTRGALTMIENRVGLVLFDQNGKPRVRLAVKDEGPHLLLQDENGKPRIGLTVYNNVPVLELFDEDGQMFWKAR